MFTVGPSLHFCDLMMDFNQNAKFKSNYIVNKLIKSKLNVSKVVSKHLQHNIASMSSNKQL